MLLFCHTYLYASLSVNLFRSFALWITLLPISIFTDLLCLFRFYFYVTVPNTFVLYFTFCWAFSASSVKLYQWLSLRFFYLMFIFCIEIFNFRVYSPCFARCFSSICCSSCSCCSVFSSFHDFLTDLWCVFWKFNFDRLDRVRNAEPSSPFFSIYINILLVEIYSLWFIFLARRYIDLLALFFQPRKRPEYFTNDTGYESNLFSRVLLFGVVANKFLILFKYFMFFFCLFISFTHLKSLNFPF